MKERAVTASVEAIRRLAVTKQHLSGDLPKSPTKRNILDVVRDLAYIQWDPVTIVAPSHLISLWSRLGRFRVSDLESLMWNEKKLFEHWSPMASLVLTEDYPLYSSLMRRYPSSLTGSWGSHEVSARKFLSAHLSLRKRVLADLEKGPLLLNQFRDYSRSKRDAPDWTPRNDVSEMLFHLLMSGDVMVVGHDGNQNLWGLSRDFLPTWTDMTKLSVEEFEDRAVQRAIRALGTASPREINYYFVRGRYKDIVGALARLESRSKVCRVVAKGLEEKKETRYVHSDDLDLLESESEDFVPRLSLIAPFDNLIAGRDRARRVFDFDYVHEQFLPKNKRKYGTYVLPIIWGERLIGRLDPVLDKTRMELVINSVHAEPGAPRDGEVADRIDQTVQSLAEFIGAKGVVYTHRVPEAWKGFLR